MGNTSEIDPIKSNPTSHKAIGVVAVTAVIVGLGYWLAGSPLTARNALCPFISSPEVESSCCPAGGAPEQADPDNQTLTPETDAGSDQGNAPAGEY